MQVDKYMNLFFPLTAKGFSDADAKLAVELPQHSCDMNQSWFDNLLVSIETRKSSLCLLEAHPRIIFIHNRVN